jgi:hypothetical protein
VIHVDAGSSIPSMRSVRVRVTRFAVVAGAVALVLFMGRRWPHDQTVHYVLGDGAPRVEELDARWEEARAGAHARAVDDEPAREATFRYAKGQAPRVVTHEPRLADGDYDVEIEIATPSLRTTVTRRVNLSGGATSIDLAQAVPR